METTIRKNYLCEVDEKQFFLIKDLGFDREELVYGRPLICCQDIINQYKKIWYSKIPQLTTDKLKKGLTSIKSFMILIMFLKDPDEFLRIFNIIIHTTVWKDIIQCIYVTNECSEMDKKMVCNHRCQLKNYFLEFMENLKNWHDFFYLFIKK